mgnify:CR=1 FL=1
MQAGQLMTAGRLIGINTAIYSPSGANAGIGFAVPVDTVNAIVPQLIKHGKLTRPGLGINILSDQIAALFLRILGEDAGPDEVATMYGLWAAATARTGDPRDGWKVVVSALLQDPKMVFY